MATISDRTTGNQHGLLWLGISLSIGLIVSTVLAMRTKEGVEFNSSSPQYFYTKVNDLKIEMLGEATKDAKLRAEQLAINSGGKVGALRSAAQGVFQITTAYSTEVSDHGIYDTSTIEKSIKAVVTVQYSI